MNRIVLKFGGTSMATPERIERVAERIVAVRNAGHQVVVVVSAMGRMTDDLLALARRIHPDPPERELDMLLTVGERISMALLSMALSRRQCAAISFTGSQSGILTDTQHSEARIVEVRAARIEEALGGGRVVIVAGFQGVSREREITTLGRGGSDTSAVALAVALGAIRCELCTDVDGVFTADPRHVPRARRLSRLSYDEMLELAANGAQVLHPRCVAVAQQFALPLQVRSSFHAREGTVIGPMTPMETRGVRAMTLEANRTLVRLAYPANAEDGGAGWLEAVQARRVRPRRVQRWRAPEGELVWDVILADEALEKLGDTLEKAAGAGGGRLLGAWPVTLLTFVGTGLSEEPGLLQNIETALREAGLDIETSTSSAHGITVAVRGTGIEPALPGLHARLGLDAADAGNAADGDAG